MIVREQNVQWEEIVWQPTIDGLVRDVPIQVCMSSEMPEGVLFPGLGEEQYATEAGVKALGEVGLNFAGAVLPFHILEPTRANIERTCNEAPVSIAEQLNERAGRAGDQPMPIIGKSQGGGAVLLTGRSAPERYDAIGVLAPVGLNKEFLGDGDDRQRRTFLRRLMVTNILHREQNPFVDRGNWRAGLEVGKRVLSDLLSGRLMTKVNFAMEHDFAEDVKRLCMERPLRIFVGDEDPIFKADELSHVLGKVGCDHIVEVIPGSHASLLTRRGKEQIQTVGTWMAQHV